MSGDTLTTTELCVKNAWINLLKVDDVLPSESFFELGGDSLLMIDMIFQLSKDLDMQIDPGLLFEDASLRGFAALLDASRGRASDLEEGAI